MKSDDLPSFRSLVGDLCIAFNRPFTDDVVRVFWDSLKDLPLGLIRNRAELYRRIGKKFPAPWNLRPEKSRSDIEEVVRGPTIQEQLCEFLAKKFHSSHGLRTDLITYLQYSLPWTYLYRKSHVKWTNSKGEEVEGNYPQCVGVVIPAAKDGSRPGYRVMIEDMHAGIVPGVG